MTSAEEFLGLDIGSSRIGVARGSSAARLSEPLKTIPAKEAIDELAALVEKYKPAAIVVGLPRNLGGNETDQTDKVRQWVDEAKKSLNLPFYWQDEALTSHLAEVRGTAQNQSDAAAAAIILQDFLDASKDDRVEA